MRYSIKQLLRTPWKTSFFFLMLAFGTSLLVIGFNLWIQTSNNLQKIDDSFTTIGTVTQKEDGMSIEEQWDAALNDNIYIEKPIYSQLLSVDLLKKLDVDYISEPEQRPWYAATSQDFNMVNEYAEEDFQNLIVEMKPVRDCIPNKPVEMKIVKVLCGDKNLVNKTIYFCDHFSENPSSMHSDKTYIAYLLLNPYNFDRHENWNGVIEYSPRHIFENSDLWYEVTEDFYNTENGIIWKTVIEELDTAKSQMVPLITTEDINLIYAFHEKEAQIVEGNDISDAEYREGKKVCLVSQSFASVNGYKIGDCFELELLFAQYTDSVGESSHGSGIDIAANKLLNSNNKGYDTFQKEKFNIVGIYAYPTALETSADRYGLGQNTIIVPTKAIKNINDENIIENAPMQGWNTSFRIKNGTINDFIKVFQETPESEFLEIQFYDNGYEQFAGDLKNMKTIAIMMFIAGILFMIAIIIFFLYFSVIQQKDRTALERALGMTKKQCVSSIVTGILILSIVSTLVGGISSMILNKKVQEIVSVDTNFFSMVYTKGIQTDTSQNSIIAINNKQMTVIVLSAIFIENSIICGLAIILVEDNLKIPPIYLLGRKE